MSSDLAIPQLSLAEMSASKRRMSTSLDLTKNTDRLRLEKAMQGCDGKLTEMVNKTITVTDYVAHDVEMNGKSEGEKVHGVRLVLLSKDGKSYDCVSETLLQSIQLLAFSRGDPPWKNGLKLTICSKKKAERNIYWFEAE